MIGVYVFALHDEMKYLDVCTPSTARGYRLPLLLLLLLLVTNPLPVGVLVPDGEAGDAGVLAAGVSAVEQLVLHDSHLPDDLSRKADVVEQSHHKGHLDEHARRDVRALDKRGPASQLQKPIAPMTHTPNSHVALASRAPNSEYTIMPFQKGKGDLVTWARISCDTWYEKLRCQLNVIAVLVAHTSCPSIRGTATVVSCARAGHHLGRRFAARERGCWCGPGTAGSRAGA